ncbi:hypothetical protein [Streptomyces sp. NPDC001404]|uniref:hypothetical protein n=1 Tax=Streptomyces sp. NPDC001404 TaxID=3364571 RepID=UPI00368489F7
MTLTFDVKAALFDQLKTLVPAGTQCTFAQTGKADRRHQVWLGETTDDELQPTAMRAGPRKPTSVTGYVDVHALVTTPGDPMAAERGVNALREHIAEACRRVDIAALPGLLDVRAESANVDTAETTDGAFSALTVRIRIRGRVT